MRCSRLFERLLRGSPHLQRDRRRVARRGVNGFLQRLSQRGSPAALFLRNVSSKTDCTLALSHVTLTSSETTIPSDRVAGSPVRAHIVKRYDARNGRRVSLRRPAPALLANRRVDVHDLSDTGFGITHDFRLEKGETCVLEFRWGNSFSISCTVIRCVFDGSRFRTGLAIDRVPRAYSDQVAEALVRKAMHEATLPSFFAPVRSPK